MLKTKGNRNEVLPIKRKKKKRNEEVLCLPMNAPFRAPTAFLASSDDSKLTKPKPLDSP